MKKCITLLGLALLMSSLGCMTSAVIREARREPKPMESLAKKDPATGEITAPLDYPKAMYLLLPLSIPIDIATSPFQLLIVLLWPKC